MDRNALSGIRYAPDKMYVIESVDDNDCWTVNEVCFSKSVAEVLTISHPGSRYRLVKVIDASDLGIDHKNFEDVQSKPGFWAPGEHPVQM